MGIKQSGIPDLVLADLVRDANLLEIAREASFNLVKNDDIENYPLLNKKITKEVVEIEL